MTLLDPRLWGAIALALGAVYIGGRMEQHHDDAKEFAAERTQAALTAATAQTKAVEAARAEEQRRTQAQTEIADAATKDADKARDDARVAGDAAERLRRQLAGYVAAHRSAKDPAPASAGPAASDTGDLLSDLFLESVERNRQMAATADAFHIAGTACERAYDTLTAPR